MDEPIKPEHIGEIVAVDVISEGTLELRDKKWNKYTVKDVPEKNPMDHLEELGYNLNYKKMFWNQKGRVNMGHAEPTDETYKQLLNAIQGASLDVAAGKINNKLPLQWLLGFNSLEDVRKMDPSEIDLDGLDKIDYGGLRPEDKKIVDYLRNARQ